MRVENDVIHIVICHSDIFLENIDIFPVFSINIEQKLTTVMSYRARLTEERGRINLVNHSRNQNLCDVYCSSIPHEWYSFNFIASVGIDSGCIGYSGGT
jgi:hypothetical protein